MANRPEESMLVPLRKLFAAEHYKQLSDEQLLQCFMAQREEGAFAALVKRHGPMVLGVCRAVLRHTQDAEDVCQACFLLLASKPGSIRKSASLPCWLHGVAYRMAKKLAASKRRFPHQPIVDAAPASSEDDLSWREVRQIVHEELERLPQKYRKPLVLCYLEGQTLDEAAQQLGWTGGALKGMLTRGRDLLKRRLTQRGLGTPALLAAPLATETLAAGMVKATASSAVLLAAGKKVGVGISAQVAVLVNGGLKAMLMTKLKVVAAVVVLLGVGIGGMGLAGFRPGLGNKTAAPGHKDGNKTVPLVQLQEFQAKDKAQQGPAMDLHGDALPLGASARLGTLRWRHAGYLDFAAFSPDGKTVVSADNEAIHVWEFPTGKPIRRIDLSLGELPLANEPASATLKLPQAGMLSNDGKTVACFFREANKLLCYEVATGKLLSEAIFETVKGPLGRLAAVSALAFSPNDEELASLDLQGVVHIWNWRQGVELRSLDKAQRGLAGGAPGKCLAYAPDGRAIAVITPFSPMGPQQLLILNSDTGAEIRTIQMSASVATGECRIVWSPDGKTLAYSGTRTIFLVDAATGKEVGQLTDERRFVGDTTFFGKDEDGKKVDVLKPAPILHGAMIYSKDGKKLYSRGSYFRVVAEWDVGTAKLLRTLGVDPPFLRQLPGALAPAAHHFPGMALSPDGSTLVMTGPERVPEFIDVANGKETPAPGGNVMPVMQLQFAIDSKTLFTLANNSDAALRKSMHRWDVVTGKELRPVVLPESTPEVAISPDGQTLAVAVFSKGKDGPARVVLFDSSTGKEIREIAKGQPAMAFSNDAKTLAIRNRQEGRIELYEPSTAKMLLSWNIAFPVAQKLKKAKALDFASGAIPLFFSLDGRRLAAFSDPATLGVWDTSTGELLGVVAMNKDAVILSATISPDGLTIALGMDNGTAALYEVASGKRRFTLGEKPLDSKNDAMKVPSSRSGGSKVLAGGSSVAFSPDGKHVAHAGLDKVVRLWDMVTGKAVAAFRGHTGSVMCLAFAPDGRWLASGSADTTTLIWDLRGLK